jgi:aspartate aminotransferase
VLRAFDTLPRLPPRATRSSQELKDKRDLALRLVGTIPDVTCPVPNGAFYIMPDVHTYYGKKTAAGRPVGNSHELCLELLREALD